MILALISERASMRAVRHCRCATPFCALSDPRRVACLGRFWA